MFAWRVYEIRNIFLRIWFIRFLKGAAGCFQAKQINFLLNECCFNIISIRLTKLTLLEVSAMYFIHWEQDGLGISPGVEEVCKCVCCMLPTIDTKLSLLSKALYNFSVLLDRQRWKDFA